MDGLSLYETFGQVKKARQPENSIVRIETLKMECNDGSLSSTSDLEGSLLSLLIHSRVFAVCVCVCVCVCEREREREREREMLYWFVHVPVCVCVCVCVCVRVCVCLCV